MTAFIQTLGWSILALGAAGLFTVFLGYPCLLKALSLGGRRGCLLYTSPSPRD